MVIGIVGSAVLYYVFAGIGVAAGSQVCIDMFNQIEFNNPLNAFKDFGNMAFGQVFMEGFKGIGANQIFDFVAALIAFAMVDMFDTIGTLMGTCQAATPSQPARALFWVLPPSRPSWNPLRACPKAAERALPL